MADDLSASSLEIETIPLDPSKQSPPPEDSKTLKLLFWLTGIMILLLVALILGLLLRPVYIDKPLTDPRSYRYIQLENGMRIVLVHDPQSVMSAASVTVGIGYFADPWDLPGLTHYTEHMVFINSKKFPEVNGFMKFLSDNGGYANAQTVAEDTTYFFQVSKNNFERGIDMFSHLFIDPQFPQEYLDKEVYAVSSEFKQYMNDDRFRFYYATQLASERNRVYYRFKCGNVDSLKTIPEKQGINVKERITEHFNTYYSANIMTGSLLGSQSLDELEEMARRYFSPIENKDISYPKYKLENLFGKLPRVIAYTPVGQVYKLYIVFETRNNPLMSQVKPLDFLYEIVNSDVEGGFKNNLIQKGWLTEVGIFSMISRGGTYDLNSFTFTLTKVGMDHAYEILQLFYGLLKQLAASDELPRIFDEIKNLKRIIFDYEKYDGSKAEYVKQISLNLKFGKPEHVLTEDKLPLKYDHQVIKEFLQETLDLEKNLIVLSDPFLTYTTEKSQPLSIDNNKFQITNFDTINDFYAVNYSDFQVSDLFISGIKQFRLETEFKLPSANIFTPRNFDLLQPNVERIDSSLIPTKIHESKGYTVWHSQFSVNIYPTANLVFDLHAADSCLSMSKRAQFLIYFEYLKMKIMSIVENPRSAGYEIDFSLMIDTGSLWISGFSDQITHVANYLLNFAKFKEISENTFKVIKSSAISQAKNVRSSGLITFGLIEINSKLLSCYFETDDILSALKETNYSSYIDSLKEIQNYLHLEIIGVGNIAQDKLMEDIMPIMKSFSLSADKKVSKIIDKNADSAAYQPKSQFEDSQDQVSLNYYYGGPRDLKTISVLKTFESTLNSFAMRELRTIKALGYIAQALQDRNIPGNGMHIVVQGPEKYPYIFNKEIEKVLKDFEAVLEGLSDEEIENMKKSYLSKTSDLATKLGAVSDLWETELRFSTYDFDFHNKIRTQVSLLTKDDIITVYKMFFSNSSRLSYQVSNDPINKDLLLLGSETYNKIAEHVVKSLKEWEN